MIEAPAQLPSLMLRPRPSLSSPPTRSRELPLALDSNLLIPSVRPPSPDLQSAVPQIHPIPDPVARLPTTAGPRALRSASRVVTAPPGHAPWQRATAPSPTDGATRSRPALLQGPLPKLLPLPGDDKAIEEAVGGCRKIPPQQVVAGIPDPLGFKHRPMLRSLASGAGPLAAALAGAVAGAFAGSCFIPPMAT